MRSQCHDTPEFFEFWKLYPRKIAKPHARKAFARALKTASAGQIIAGLRAYAFSANVQFQPHPATWLNQERWVIEAATDPVTTQAIPAPASRATWRDKYDGGADASMFFPATRHARMDASEPFTIDIGGDE